MQLVVVAGLDADRAFALSAGTLRVLGRQEGMTLGTNVVERGRQRELRQEDLAVATDRWAVVRGGPGVDIDSLHRDEDVDLQDEAVSQTHALLLYADGALSIVDVASKNGTFVNGSRVDQCALSPGDIIRVGESRLRVDDDAAVH